MNNTPLITRDPLPTIELPKEVIMKILNTNEYTINDAYEVTTLFKAKHPCFRDRELYGIDAIKVLSTDYKFAIYGHIDSMIRSGIWHNNEIMAKLDQFLEERKTDRLEVIDKGLIT